MSEEHIVKVELSPQHKLTGGWRRKRFGWKTILEYSRPFELPHKSIVWSCQECLA